MEGPGGMTHTYYGLTADDMRILDRQARMQLEAIVAAKRQARRVALHQNESPEAA